MTEQLVVAGFLLLLLGLAFASVVYRNIRLRQEVKNSWGKIPRVRNNRDHEDSLHEVWEILKKYHPGKATIDDVTWSDLNMQQVFQLLNITYSSVGSEALYASMRSYGFNSKKIEEIKNLMDYFEQHPADREKIQYQFAKLGKEDHNFVQSYLYAPRSQLIANSWLYPILGIMPLVFLAVFLAGFSLGILLMILNIFLNVMIYMRQKHLIEKELLSMQYLIQTIQTAKKIAKVASPYQSELEKQVKKIKKITWTAPSFTIKSGSDMEIFAEYFNMAFLLPFISFNFVLNKLGKEEQAAFDTWEKLGDLEVAIAVLNFRTFMPDTCLPKFTNELQVTAETCYHPLLSHPVANDVDWKRSTLVTGSNASGKSTYVKSIAINVILAQTLGICCADSFSLPRSHVLTSMALEDDILAGESYFIAEIKSVKRIIALVKTKEVCLCFIDEILKGTNTVERISASAAILNWLVKYPSLAFVATHDVELPEILNEKCDNVHFSETVTKENGVEFDFMLHQGSAKTRNAIMLLEVMDYPKKIVDEAFAEAEYFDKNRYWRKAEE